MLRFVAGLAPLSIVAAELLSANRMGDVAQHSAARGARPLADHGLVQLLDGRDVSRFDRLCLDCGGCDLCRRMHRRGIMALSPDVPSRLSRLLHRPHDVMLGNRSSAARTQSAPPSRSCRPPVPPRNRPQALRLARRAGHRHLVGPAPESQPALRSSRRSAHLVLDLELLPFVTDRASGADSAHLGERNAASRPSSSTAPARATSWSTIPADIVARGDGRSTSSFPSPVPIRLPTSGSTPIAASCCRSACCSVELTRPTGKTQRDHRADGLQR